MSIDLLEKVAQGKPLSAAQWNRVIDVLKRAASVSAQKLAVDAGGAAHRETHNKTRFPVYEITELTDDNYFMARERRGTAMVGAAVPVLKSLDCLKAQYDGKTFNLEGTNYTYTYDGGDQRDSDDGSTVETQFITPPYFVGALIVVMRITPILDDANGLPIRLADASGREFSK